MEEQKGVSNLVLVRHGESMRNVAKVNAEAKESETYSDGTRDMDVELTCRGLLQAKETGEHLSQHLRFAFDCAFTSPYRRTVQTAKLVLASQGGRARTGPRRASPREGVRRPRWTDEARNPETVCGRGGTQAAGRKVLLPPAGGRKLPGREPASARFPGDADPGMPSPERLGRLPLRDRPFVPAPFGAAFRGGPAQDRSGSGAGTQKLRCYLVRVRSEGRQSREAGAQELQRHALRRCQCIARTVADEGGGAAEQHGVREREDGKLKAAPMRSANQWLLHNVFLALLR